MVRIVATRRRRPGSGGGRSSYSYYGILGLVGLGIGAILSQRRSHRTSSSSLWDQAPLSLQEALRDFGGGGAGAAGGDDHRHNHKENMEDQTPPHTLAGLDCRPHGGPNDPAAAEELVYWQDIASDATHTSPLMQSRGSDRDGNEEQFLTFEPDAGGWNNIRMAMETVLAMALAMGRTLVLPPEKEMYLLKTSHGKHGAQRDTFSFAHFFHMEAIHHEHAGLNIITMTEFLQTQALTGKMRYIQDGRVAFPPNHNQTNWDGDRRIDQLFAWLRTVSHVADHWSPEHCVAVFPSGGGTAMQDVQNLQDAMLTQPVPAMEQYIDHPVPVDASPLERLQEQWAGRDRLCVYNETMQGATHVHFPVNAKTQTRLLVHFYAFLFFMDYKQDLWMKRFVRDHVRYVDDIQCAAARVVEACRAHARQTDPTNLKGEFDAFHVRRGDFQYKATRVEASKLLEMAQRKLKDGATVYMATDERDKNFFAPLKEKYDLVFLDDFHDEALMGINTNYYGMIDQLVATRSRTFFGCWFSTFTGYIDRLRGYHADAEQKPGYEQGIHDSWFYALPDRFDHMQHYYPVKKSFFAREFPTSWRLIDSTLETT